MERSKLLFDLERTDVGADFNLFTRFADAKTLHCIVRAFLDSRVSFDRIKLHNGAANRRGHGHFSNLWRLYAQMLEAGKRDTPFHARGIHHQRERAGQRDTSARLHVAYARGRDRKIIFERI